MKITLSNSEYNFIKRYKNLNIKDIFTDNFKKLLNKEMNFEWENDKKSFYKLKSILNKLNQVI